LSAFIGGRFSFNQPMPSSFRTLRYLKSIEASCSGPHPKRMRTPI
jgi:hypothetical protein